MKHLFNEILLSSDSRVLGCCLDTSISNLVRESSISFRLEGSIENLFISWSTQSYHRLDSKVSVMLNVIDAHRLENGLSSVSRTPPNLVEIHAVGCELFFG